MAEISRRQFLRFAGLGVLGTATSALAGCNVLKAIPTTNNVASRLATVQAGGAAATPAAVALGSIDQAANTPQAVQQGANTEGTFGKFSINGAPAKVEPKDLPKLANERQNGREIAKGDVEHKNTIGLMTDSGSALGTDFFTAHPGNYKTFDWKSPDIEGGSALVYSGENQKRFTDGKEHGWPLPEWAFSTFYGAGMKLEIPGIEGKSVTLQLNPEKGHAYYVLVTGPRGPRVKDDDQNRTAVVSGYNRAWVQADYFSSGQFFDQQADLKGPDYPGHLEQQMLAVHGEWNGDNNCGADGCTRVTVIMVDSDTGAYTAIRQTGANGKWQLAQTNIVGVKK